MSVTFVDSGWEGKIGVREAVRLMAIVNGFSSNAGYGGGRKDAEDAEKMELGGVAEKLACMINVSYSMGW